MMSRSISGKTSWRTCWANSSPPTMSSSIRRFAATALRAIQAMGPRMAVGSALIPSRVPGSLFCPDRQFVLQPELHARHRRGERAGHHEFAGFEAIGDHDLVRLAPAHFDPTDVEAAVLAVDVDPVAG